MKFLNKDGELVEGEPLTDAQLQMREMILTFVHENVCGGSFHSAWERRNEPIKCEKIANYFVTHFALTPLPGTSFMADIAKAIDENQPQSID